MEYKGYKITAEVETYETWTIDEDGSPVEWAGDGDGLTVTGYFYTNEAVGDYFFQAGSQMDMEQHRIGIDMHLKELEREAA